MTTTERPSPAEVLAWMGANGAGLKRASKHFGLAVSTIASWRRKGTTAPGTRGAQPSRPPLTVINTPPPPPPAVLSKSHRAKARKVLGLYLDRLADPEVVGASDARDCVAVVNGLVDRIDITGALKRAQAARGEVDPTTPEGEEQLVKDLRALPPELLKRAMEAG